MKIRNVFFCSAVLLIASLPILAQGTYTQIDYPGAILTEALGINNAGDIVGSYQTNSGWHGFILSKGIYTTIEDVDHIGGTFLFGINDRGQVVGCCSPTGFMYNLKKGTFSEITYPGATETYPQGINNAGTVSGYYRNSTLFGFELSGSTYRTIAPQGGSDIQMYGISTSGEVAGHLFSPKSGYVNVVFNQGKYTKVRIDATNVLVDGISPSGDALVGTYGAVGQPVVGFKYTSGVLTTLKYLGAVNTFAFGVNDAGVVVGYASFQFEGEHGFIWTPSAEAAPSSGQQLSSKTLGAQ
jgi:hypothetical protein